MSPIDLNVGSKVSLTKHYNIDTLVDEIAQLDAGLSQSEVGAALRAPHHELADDLFVYDESDRLVEDVLVSACRERKHEARYIVWAALLLGDPRLQEIVVNEMTLPSGRLDPAKFSKDEALNVVQSQFSGSGAGKAASNLLRWFETAGIATGTRHRSSIVALETTHPTAFAVPAVLDLIEDRLARELEPQSMALSTDENGRVDLALAFGVNHWLNLTRDEFRAAAAGRPALVIAEKIERQSLPDDLVRLHRELERKRQAILQGPPGTGKTHTARGYLEWFTAGRRDASRITELVLTLPESERTPARIADRVQELGLPGAWEIAQFHPSYSYERFVRGLQAEPVPGGVTFTAVNRVLGLLASVGGILAERGDSAELLLLVDEINRGDIAKVFGELLYSLEYRGDPVATPYAIDGDATLVLPANLLLLGTMNTADQSIAMVDKALRRRFAWLTLSPDAAVIDEADTFAGDPDRGAARWLFQRVSDLFDRSDPDLRRLQLGHSYFLPDEKPEDNETGIDLVARRFAVEAWPLLEEYEAEGLIDPDQLSGLLAVVGWTAAERPTDQTELADTVASKLRSVTEPE